MIAETSAQTTPSILIIDDDEEIRYSLGRVLGSRQYRISEAGSGEEGIALAKKGAPDLVFLDIRMGGMSGIETLQHLRSAHPQLLVVLMTAFGTAQTAIEAMKFGAYDYVMKPFDADKVLAIAESALKTKADLQTAAGYKPKVKSEDYKEGIVGSSPAMQEVFKVIGQVTASDVTVLISGESGTGKELVARCIFQHSHRAGKAFMAVNCAAIPENLIESELFGHERGSFTGATGQRSGKFELCDGGTLFLDEIGDMSLATQTKILRVLQEGEIQRVGGSETLKVDVRVIAATNRDLEVMVKAKTFREDLYYRLAVVRLRLPSLRERTSDIPEIVDFMLQKLEKTKKTRVRKVAPEAMDLLVRHRWPGNVRELENAIYRSAVIAQGDTILVKDLPQELREAVLAAPPATIASSVPTVARPAEVAAPAAPVTVAGMASPAGPASVEAALDFIYQQLSADKAETILERLEREMIPRAMKEFGGNQVRASERLGITRATLRKRLDAVRGAAAE
ncbi:MAG: sigma-54-dependent Fis family transcriptional regulator [Opitutaceae bacterium]|nr:sigma-54-dependent Fis family transcriptional regulator [Opitutaceae bacterium]